VGAPVRPNMLKMLPKIRCNLWPIDDFVWPSRLFTAGLLKYDFSYRYATKLTIIVADRTTIS